MDFGRTLLTPTQTVRSWSDRGTGIPAQVCPAPSQPLYYHPPCLSVVSICGIESESYCLQIAGHKLPNSISGTGPGNLISTRPALQGWVFNGTLPQILRTSLPGIDRWLGWSRSWSHSALSQLNFQCLCLS